MSRSRSVIASLLFSAVTLAAAPPVSSPDQSALWKELGLVRTTTGQHAKRTYTLYEMQDLTGAVAAWEWQRSLNDHSCQAAAFCTEGEGRTVMASDNYLIVFDSVGVKKDVIEEIMASLPDKKDTSLPAIFTFLPDAGRVPNSARYVLGPESLTAFAPALAPVKPGFEQGAEAQVAQYKVDGSTGTPSMAVFYYPTPEMAREHAADFKKLSNAFVKRSGVLVAIVYGGANQAEADTLLSRVQYQAKITFNDAPAAPPIKPLYDLLGNILFLSGLVAALGLTAGLLYGGMRVYRRRFGRLEDEEAMTTLHLTRD